MRTRSLPNQRSTLSAFLLPRQKSLSYPCIKMDGLSAPMPVILVGVMGGMIAYGISGLFVGPIVLAVLWALIQEWTVEG